MVVPLTQLSTFKKRGFALLGYFRHNYLPAFILIVSSAFHSSSFANDAACIDSDGDGYGWNGVATCDPGNGDGSGTSNTGNCDYTDAALYNGWGWNPVTRSSCAPLSTTGGSTDNSELQMTTATCVDSDGDGWGWDGQSSCRVQTGDAVCIDTDGDGWGWDGTQSCVANDPSTAATETNAEFIPLDSDPIWPFCQAANSRHQLNFGESWGTVDTTNNVPNCVRQCSASATELPTVPGWGYESSADAECLYEYAPDVYSVPIYDPTTSTRVEFLDQFAFHLHAGGSSNWQCSLETRQSNSEPFMPNGNTSSYVFADDDDKWRFATATSRRILQIKNDPDQREFDYVGYAIIQHNQLTLYRHSLERLNCTADNPDPAFQLPDNVGAFDQLPAVGLAELINQPLNCRVIESMTRSQNTQWTFGYSSDGAAGAESQVTLMFESIDNSANQNYRFSTQLNDWQTNLYTADNDAFSRYSSTGTSSYRSDIRFKNLGTHLLVEKFDTCSISGGCTDEIAYAVCQ